MYKANIEGEGNQNSCRNGSAWVRNRPVDRVLSSYTGVEKSGTNEMSMEGVGGSVPGVVIHGREGSVGKGEEAALEAILLNNGNTGETEMGGLLGSSLGLNWTQLTAVRAMGTKNQGIAERIPRGGEACYDTEDISRVCHSPEGIAINNATNVISTIFNRYKLGEILEDLRLAPY